MKFIVQKLSSRRIRRGSVMIFVTIALLWSSAASAQMQDLNLTVYGMDCAPCAHGIKQRLQRMDGIEKVDVNLNTGSVTVEVSADNNLELREIREKVRLAGFSAKEARLRLQARVVEAGTAPLLESPSGEQFRARAEGGIAKKLAALETGEQVELTGTTKAKLEDAPEPIEVTVDEVK